MSSFSFTFAGHNTTCANRNSPSSSRHRHQRFHAHARFRLDAIHQCPSVRFLPEEGQLLVISIDSIPLKLKKKNNFFFCFADLAERSLAMSELRVGLSQKVYQTFSRQEVVRSRRFLHSHDSNSDRHTQGWLFGC